MNETDKSHDWHVAGEAEACAAILYACWMADEIHRDAENIALVTALRSRNVFSGKDPAELLHKAENWYARAGNPDTLINAAANAVQAQNRLPLLYHCLEVFLVDGIVTPQENQVFQHLKSRFKIDDETAFRALEVILLKNQL